MDKIKKYVDDVVRKLDCTNNERVEYRLQFIDHINLLKEEYIEKGYAEDSAIKYAIREFGNSDLIQNEMDNITIFKNKLLRYFIGTIFVVYCIFLILVLINPHKSGELIQISRDNGSWFGLTVNIIPFKTIIYYLTIGHKINSDIIIRNLLGKVLLFVPWGVLLPFLFQKAKNFKNAILITITVTIIIQVLRIILPIGIADIDNIILYTIGSIVGFCLYRYIINLSEKIRLLKEFS